MAEGTEAVRERELLFLPRAERARDPIRKHAVRAIAVTTDWTKQRRMWAALLQRHDVSRARS